MASALIRERILTAAQRRLGHSALGVAQGAYEPGFEDASYSVRYFRKYTGITPEAFWQQRWFVLQVPALGLRRRG